jgi:hypothetical protein
MASAEADFSNDSDYEKYAEELFSNIDSSIGALSKDRIAKLDAILENPDNYSSIDVRNVASEYGIVLDDWFYKVFDKKAQYNKE